MSDQPIIGKTEDGLILTPQLLRQQECKIKINQLCQTYGFALVPVVQIIGNNMQASVELADVTVRKPPNTNTNGAPEGGNNG
jgi:hypothetical protein